MCHARIVAHRSPLSSRVPHNPLRRVLRHTTPAQKWEESQTTDSGNIGRPVGPIWISVPISGHTPQS